MKTLLFVLFLLTACGAETVDTGIYLCVNDIEILEKQVGVSCPNGYEQMTPEEAAKDEFGEIEDDSSNLQFISY